MKIVKAAMVVAAIALVATPPGVAKPRRPAAKVAVAKKKPAKPAAPKTPTQMLAPPVPEGPAELPVAAADLTPSGRPAGSGTASSAPRSVDQVAAATAALSPAQIACQGSQGQSVAIPDATGSQTTRCGVNASVGRTDARVDYRVRPLAPH